MIVFNWYRFHFIQLSYIRAYLTSECSVTLSEEDYAISVARWLWMCLAEMTGCETLKTNTVYWCIASESKVPLIFLWNEQNAFVVGGFVTFQSVLLWWYHNDNKAYRILTVLPPPLPWSLATMSDELILQILCNIFLSIKIILMMRSGQNKSHYTTAKLSVHVWNHDLIWWTKQNWNTKTFPQGYDYKLLNRT